MRLSGKMTLKSTESFSGRPTQTQGNRSGWIREHEIDVLKELAITGQGVAKNDGAVDVVQQRVHERKTVRTGTSSMAVKVWSIFITNIPALKANITEILGIYGQKWQIEVI